MAATLGCGAGDRPASPPSTPSPPAVADAPPPGEASADAVAPDKPTIEGFRGTLTLASPTSSVVACDGSTPTVDGVEAFASEIRGALPGVSGPVYIEARIGPGAQGQRLLRALDVAVAEGPGCGLAADGWQLRATGNEPFWWAELRGGDVRWQRMDDPAPTTVRVGVPTSEAKRRVWSGRGAGDVPVAFDVRRERCRDTMASAFYPYTATLTVGDWTGTGCARTPPP
ncbi:MAG: hypothetical protein H6733_01500 [Alphaproteobacteria bacterium]|nr:hypothetical protein [Alphaproteobacteria bacterium]